MALFGRQTPRDQQKAADYALWVQQRNPLAIGSMVLGVFSLIEFGVLLVFGVAGIVLGVIALRQLSVVDANVPEAKTRGHRLAWGGIVLSAISLVIASVLYLMRGRT